MSYCFFIGSMMLPIPPPKMQIKMKNKNKTINLINEGEVNLIKTPGLTEISFDARLPNAKYPFANYDTSLADSLTNRLNDTFSYKKADYFLNSFESAKKTQAPVRLIISRMNSSFQMLFDTNLLVTLEDYNVNEDAAEGFDIVVPLRFKQYRPFATKECEVTTDENGVQHLKVKETRPVLDKTIPAVYRMRNERSIWEACQRISGGSLDWRTVMQNSGGGNPLGLPGMVLRLG